MESNRGGLGRKLLPKAITAKRLRRKHSKDIDGETTASDDATLNSGSVPAAAPSLHGHASDNSLHATATTASDSTDTSTGANGNMAHRNESPSLVSYDSDPDLRPHTLSAHPSQIGYLTTSSPLVQDAHLKDLPAAKQADYGPRSATFQVSTNDSSESLPGIATAKTGLLQPRSGSSSTRSRSPVGRFRDVFRSNKTASNASTSPDRRSDASDREHRERDIPTDSKPTTNVPPLKPTAKPTAPAGPTEPTETTGRPKTAPGRPRGQSKSKIDISIVPPRTPPAGDKPPPVIVNTPPTPTEPSNPLLQTSPTKNSTPDAAPPSGASSTGPSSGGIMQTRRVRAGSGSIGPSKLSNITLPPLSPTPENGPSGSSPAASGFFSSMISAAQNAANTFSNSISTANLAPQKGKTTAGKDKDTTEEENTETQESQPSASNNPMEEKELAVKTLGQGDLSLSQLGLAETNSTAATPVVSKFSDPAAPRSRSDSAPVESEHASNVDTLVDDSQGLSRPLSLYEPGLPGDRTPPTASVYEGKSDIKRSGSVRSAIGGGQRGRQRGGSTATGTTIGAAIAAVNTSMANPSANASAPKLTGFAVASKKRNRDFHNLFKSVPDDDYLIEDYSCALQREILAHGRLYVSEGHLCFSSNIFGWVTTLVMSFDEIVSVEKRSTALVFKNGLMISTLHAKHIFASFTSRDSTYDLIVNIWKLGHPSLKSSLNGVSLDETGGDKTEKVDIEPPVEHQSPPETDEEESEDGSDVYDEDEDNDDTPETTQQTEISATNGDAEKPAARKVSGPAISAAGATEKPKETAAATTDNDFPGPPTHAPTDCGDTDTHYDKIMGDDVIPAPLGKVYSMLFGAQSPKWFVKWLTDDQKCTELQMEDKIGLSLENKTRNYTYIKPLNAPIGPKQTKCIVSEVVDNLDFDKSANITVTTQTPDVPSGNIFSVKTRYCLSWAENNATRVQMCCMIEWTGKSWLKGPIEKGTNDGQSQYAKELFAGLKSAVSSRSRSGTQTGGSAPKGKKKGKKGKPAQAATPTTETEVLKKNATQSWGIFTPVQPFLGPVVDIVGPLLTGNLMYGLLVGLLVTTWFGFGFNGRQAGGGLYGGRALSYVGHYPDRVAAYEEIWRREESELWDWLEERVALDRLGNGAEGLGVRRRAVEPRTVEEKLREERMDNREIREAIRVTEEKLKILKEVISKRQGHGA